MQANVGVEQAQNRMLLLNALRAAKRRPMHFTSIVSLTLPVAAASPSVGVTLPLGSEAAGAATVSPSLRAEVPSFNVAVLDSQKFVRGITTPLRPSLVRHYLEQGWAPMLLLSLVIREIAFVDPSGTERRVFNDPGRKAEFEAFQAELRAMLACGFRLTEEDPLAGIDAPAFALPQSTSLMSALAGVARDGLVVVPQRDEAGRDTGQWQLARPRSDVVIHFAAPEAPACRALPDAQRQRLLRSNREKSAGKGAVMDFIGPDSHRTMRMMARSPQAILGYMGELVRAEQDGGAQSVRYTPTTAVEWQHGRSLPIFRVSRGDARGEAFVSVEYEGERYSVSSEAGDLSSQSLSLISQLIALQKEASEIPITAPIRLIGQ